MDALKRLLRLPTSPTKGKARAISPERASLLPPGPSPSIRSRRNSRPESRASVVSSHGRGPLMPDSDEEAEDGEDGGGHRHRRRLAKRKTGGYGTLPDVASSDGGDEAALPADGEHQQVHSGDRTTKVLLWIALTLLAFAVLALAIVHIYLGHLVAHTLANNSPITLARRGLIVQGPDKLSIASVENDVIMVQVSAKAGVDVRKALEWESKDSPKAGRWAKWEAQVARWAVGKAGVASIEIRDPISLIPLMVTEDRRLADVVSCEMIATYLPPFSLPLLYPSPSSPLRPDGDLARLDLSVPVRISSPALLGAFANASLHQGVAKVETVVPGEVSVTLGKAKTHGWVEGLIGKVGRMTVSGIKATVEAEVPSIPGADDPASLVNLTSYKFFPIDPRTLEESPTSLGLNATAIVTNPLAKLKALAPLSFDWDVPWRLPFAAYLPSPSPSSPSQSKDDVLMAHVDILPFHFSKSRHHFPISLTGALNHASEEDGSADPALSAALGVFLGRFLKGLPSPVRIRYDAAYTALPSSLTPPPLLGKLLDNVILEVPFPGADADSGQLLRHVTIADMRVSPSGGEMVCSGTVHGELVLSRQLAGLQTMLDVSEIMPDVYIYDGSLPPLDDDDDTDDDDGDGDYPPLPTPKNAFGRIRTKHFVPCTTTQKGGRTFISARLTDVPLELLSNRGDVFRRYLGKILFGTSDKGVETGVRGIAGVKAQIDGLGAVEMGGLPIEGTFYVGGSGDFGKMEWRKLLASITEML